MPAMETPKPDRGPEHSEQMTMFLYTLRHIEALQPAANTAFFRLEQFVRLLLPLVAGGEVLSRFAEAERPVIERFSENLDHAHESANRLLCAVLNDAEMSSSPRPRSNDERSSFLQPYFNAFTTTYSALKAQVDELLE